MSTTSPVAQLSKVNWSVLAQVLAKITEAKVVERSFPVFSTCK